MKGNRPAAKREDDGPRGWFLAQVESTYSRITPADSSGAVIPAAAAAAGGGAGRRRHATAFTSAFQPGAGESALEPVAQTVWAERLAEYKRRKARAARAAAAAAPGGLAPPAPVVPGGRNWVPLGPSVVLNGQTVGEEPVAGRISGLAVAPGGAIVYAASAAGGVFRSDDAGTSWRSLMDGFDVDPTDFASTSLACGAVAIDPNDPQRVYVGTGEGDTHQMFNSRIVNALPAYRGIGPIRTDDGGDTWVTETVAAGEPPLAGKAFFALAVDPRDREHVVAATTAGLYRRVRAASGAGEWRQVRPGIHSSAVVARAGATTRFYAAEWGAGVFHSADGTAWQPAGTGFPAANVGRIALGCRPDLPDLIYAFVCNTNGAVLGVYRLDGVGDAWKKIAGPPDVIPTDNGRGQGDYDLAIAVDPQDANLIYLGGSFNNVAPWPGSVWRCPVKAAGTGYKFDQPSSIGTHAHADVHVLAHTPGMSDELWCGCDGGVFLNRAPRGGGQFAGLNHGLSCLHSNFIGQHPTDPGIILTGLQDNGTAHTSGGPQWSHVLYGDGGYCLFNWADPARVLCFMNGTVWRSNTGGVDHSDWTEVWDFGSPTMTQPVVSPPFNPASPGDAEWVAVGAGNLVFVSKDFAGSWPMQFSLPGGNAAGQAFALAFASTTRLFIGTTLGRVFRADRVGNTWTVARFDAVPGGPMPVKGLITDVAVDWSDPTLASAYVCLGGMGDARHVWRFDGAAWAARSGLAAGQNLLDVEHNAMAVERAAPFDVYVGADIGVWHSADHGVSWAPLQNGLPDAPVFDLGIHPTQRLLRAATHGRGVYEIALP